MHDRSHPLMDDQPAREGQAGWSVRRWLSTITSSPDDRLELLSLSDGATSVVGIYRDEGGRTFTVLALLMGETRQISCRPDRAWSVVTVDAATPLAW